MSDIWDDSKYDDTMNKNPEELAGFPALPFVKTSRRTASDLPAIDTGNMDPVFEELAWTQRAKELAAIALESTQTGLRKIGKLVSSDTHSGNPKVNTGAWQSLRLSEENSSDKGEEASKPKSKIDVHQGYGTFSPSRGITTHDGGPGLA